MLVRVKLNPEPGLRLTRPRPGRIQLEVTVPESSPAAAHWQIHRPRASGPGRPAGGGPASHWQTFKFKLIFLKSRLPGVTVTVTVFVTVTWGGLGRDLSTN